MKKLLLLCCISLLAFADRSGPYIGGAYGTTAFEDKGYYASQGYSDRVDDNSESFRIYGGAYINKYLSVEVDYTDFGDFKGTNALNQSLNESFTALGVSTVAHYPLYDDRIDTFLKIGVADMSWDESGALKRSDNTGALSFGLGAGYRFAEDYMLKIGYEFYSFELQDGSASYDWQIDHFFAAFEVQF
jgi:hypothetical protein